MSGGIPLLPQLSRPLRRPLIGLDVGTRRIGVARSDELGLMASPETTVAVAEGARGMAAAVAEIVGLTRQWSAARVVVGIPRNMRGEKGVQAEWTTQFADALRIALRAEHIPVSTYDERLSSVEAERADRATGGTAKKRRANPLGRTSLDARAAAVILQAYLDRERSRRGEVLDALDVDDART